MSEHVLIDRITKRCEICVDGPGCTHKFEVDKCEALEKLAKDFADRQFDEEVRKVACTGCPCKDTCTPKSSETCSRLNYAREEIKRDKERYIGKAGDLHTVKLFLDSEKPDGEPVDMDDMKKRVQTNLLIARKEMQDTNTLTMNAMVCITDALFYLVQNIDAPKTQKFSVEVPDGISIENVLKCVVRDMKKKKEVNVDWGDPNGDHTVYVCRATGNYCSMCTPGPCEHRKG